jgi:ribonuclease Z
MTWVEDSEADKRDTAGAPSPMGGRVARQKVPRHWKIHPDLVSYVTNSCTKRSGIDNDENSDDGEAQLDSSEVDDGAHDGTQQVPQYPTTNAGFSVFFLGTGAGVPSTRRSNSCTALRLGASGTYLFDVGEGAQRQISLCNGVSPGAIRKIFITHLHGDHILGLPGLLMRLQQVAKVSPSPKKQKVQIYGPEGLHNFIAASLSLAYFEIKLLEVEVFELVGGSRRWVHPGAVKHYARDFAHRNLKRYRIRRDDKTYSWTLETADEVFSPEDAIRLSSNPLGVHVHAAEVQHLPKLHCFGYVVTIPVPPRNLDADKALSLGVQPGKKYRLLKSGFDVSSDDDPSVIVKAGDVLIGEAKQRPQKFVLLGDCCGIPEPMVRLCFDADVLVHEATLTKYDSDQKFFLSGHSTPQMAASFADHVRARVLMLNHVPVIASHEDSDSESAEPGGDESGAPACDIQLDHAELSVTAAAKSALTPDSRTRVQLAHDLMNIVVPQNGFHFDHDEAPPDERCDSDPLDALDSGAIAVRAAP